MSTGRMISSGCALLAVAGGAVVVVGMTAKTPHHAAARQPTQVVATPRPVVKTFAGETSAVPTGHAPTHVASPSRVPVRSTTAAVPASSSAAPPSSAPPPAPSSAVPPVVTHAATHTPARATRAATHAAAPAPVTHRAAAPRGQSLPLRFTTSNATRVITVTAHSTGSTTATLQAWNKAAGGGWSKYGSAVTAHIGAQGMSSHPSESRSATPIGSFTLTQAFGAYSNPGTSLPYRHTDAGDWWISQPGPLYNTHRHCTSGCKFTQGDPNEHLYYETPYYDYAVVIDYNTANAPGGVHQGAGSAFFLHVTDGHPTAGCVSIPMSKLTTIMRWLTPSAHPRILIGTD